MGVYRQYEDPYKLEKRLEEVRERIARCTNEDELPWLYEEEAELKERINFAWQDDEYDCEYMRENYPEDYNC